MSELVTAYLERAVALRQRLDMWWHLYRCEACRHYYDQMRRTVRMLASGPERPPDGVTEDRLVAEARKERPPPA